MITKNERDLIHAIADADLGKDVMIGIVSGLEDEQMPILTEYIRGELEEGREVLKQKVLEAKMILLGEIEVEDDE
ncbi:MAG: hypothetical protein II254_00540 [Oscillospiraceae bacterium]|nr:hypothetical protein [Oscillospiraceae bacterium]